MSAGRRLRRALDALSPGTRGRLARLLAPELALGGLPALTDTQAARVRPTFVLSTGRAGTLWLAELLRESGGVLANHASQPELVRQSRLAYEGATSLECQAEIVRAARDDFMSAAEALDLRYVETNNRLTFLAPAAAVAYPASRFVHVVRDPEKFVASGMARNWYHGHPADTGRVTHPDPSTWAGYSDPERIAWLWQATNGFIEEFFSGLDPARRLFTRAEDLFENAATVETLCQFIGIREPRADVVRRAQSRPRNVGSQRAGTHPQLTPDERDAVLALCPLAKRYGYAD